MKKILYVPIVVILCLCIAISIVYSCNKNTAKVADNILINNSDNDIKELRQKLADLEERISLQDARLQSLDSARMENAHTMPTLSNSEHFRQIAKRYTDNKPKR